MPLLFKWLSFILIVALAVSIFFWFRLRRASRFQGRLTLFFFLFVVIPLTPLALLLGQLLMTSTETFMLPGVEESLTQSLETFRRQLNDRGEQFLKLNENVNEITPEVLTRADVEYFGVIQFANRVARLDYFVSRSENETALQETILTTSVEQAFELPGIGKIFTDNGRDYFECWIGADSTFRFIGYVIPNYMVSAKNRVTHTLSNYTTLVLLGETMVEGNAVWFVVFVFVLFIAFVSVLLARKVSAGVSGPIRTLTEGMRKIGAGDLNYRVQVKAKDEVAYLVSSFNHMADELKTSRESLQRAERAAAWRDIARQVSHEIKNPLTPIEFSIFRLESSLPDEMLENTDLKESMRIIKEEITSIRRIANTFSKFAKMPHSELAPADIGAIVKESVELFRHDADNKKISIFFEQDAGIPETPLDAQQIKGVIHNILKNAIEASSAEGAIRVSVHRLKGEPYNIQIKISDNGSGMTEEIKRRIFDPYFTTKEEGSGIGLFLAQRIIADHHGDIQVKSAPGKGTTFTIRL